MRKVYRPEVRSGTQRMSAPSASEVAGPLMPKSAKKRRRSRFRFTKPKVKKLPGFDAFKVTKETEDGIIETKVISPEHGIHSLEWALATPSQDSPFLKLPTEVRNKIYSLVFADLTIRPYKKGKKFRSVGEELSEPLMILYRDLSLVCRQLYIDTVGGALLYRVATFSFDSPQLMKNYLSAINPAHKDAIRTINLRLRSTHAAPTPPVWPLKILTALPNLQFLEIEILVDRDHCSPELGVPRAHYGSNHRWTLKQEAFLKISNEKVWMRLKGSHLTALDVKFEVVPLHAGRQAPQGSRLWKDDPKLVGFGEFVRNLIGLGTN